MEIFNFDQCSTEWFEARMGLPTASKFGEILMSETTATYLGYVNKLAAEIITRVPQKEIYSKRVREYLDRGKEFEPEARHEYMMQTGNTVHEVGLVRDSGMGCSPDGLVVAENRTLNVNWSGNVIGDFDWGLEIKVPLPGTHVGWIYNGECPRQHWPQVQGGMMITGLDRWDFVSYCPEMMGRGRAIFIVEVKRDEEYINTLRNTVGKFIYNVHQRVKRAGI